MCHGTDIDFIMTEILPEDVYGKRVLEVGAYDENGSARPHVESLHPLSYLGTDMRPGPRVDMVLNAADLPVLGEFDLVISTEMLEHAEFWRESMHGMITVVKPGGILFLTARSPGFVYHGFPDDHWRYTVEDMGYILRGAGLEIIILKPDPSPHEPGVYAKARKPLGWTWPEETDWDKIILAKPALPEGMVRDVPVDHNPDSGATYSM